MSLFKWTKSTIILNSSLMEVKYVPPHLSFDWRLDRSPRVQPHVVASSVVRQRREAVSLRATAGPRIHRNYLEEYLRPLGELFLKYLSKSIRRNIWWPDIQLKQYSEVHCCSIIIRPRDLGLISTANMTWHAVIPVNSKKSSVRSTKKIPFTCSMSNLLTSKNRSSVNVWEKYATSFPVAPSAVVRLLWVIPYNWEGSLDSLAFLSLSSSLCLTTATDQPRGSSVK